MAIYYLVFIISFILTIFDYLPYKYLKILVFTSFCVLLISLPGFKSLGVDNDGTNYEEIFKTFNNYSFWEIFTGDYIENIERGFALLNKAVGYFGGNITVVFFVVALVTGLLNYIFIYKVSPLPFTSLLFYLSFFYLYRDFTQIRYALCGSLVFWVVYLWTEKKYLVGAFVLICAFLFHSSALIILLVLPLCYFIKNRNIYLILPLVSLIGFFYNPFPLILSLGGIPEHMQIYLNEEGGGGLVVSLFSIAMMVLYAIFRDRFEKENSIYKYFQLFALGAALNLLFIQVSIFQRFAHLLFQFGVILVPMLISRLAVGREKLYFFYLHFFLNCFLLYYGLKLIHPDLIRPYF